MNNTETQTHFISDYIPIISYQIHPKKFSFRLDIIKIQSYHPWCILSQLLLLLNGRNNNFMLDSSNHASTRLAGFFDTKRQTLELCSLPFKLSNNKKNLTSLEANLLISSDVIKREKFTTFLLLFTVHYIIYLC